MEIISKIISIIYFTDYYTKGSLLAYLMRGRLQEKLAKFIFLKILKGVEALHGAEICHRDLKLDNIYLDIEVN